MADSADLGKHGLLRALCNPEPTDEFRPLRLGVVWYLTPDDPEGDGDGKKPKSKPKTDPRAYLKTGDDEALLYRRSDPDLYDALRGMCREGFLALGEIEHSGILPQGTVFFSEPVPGKIGKETAPKRREWAGAALAAVEPCDLVFLDPDNGLEPVRGEDKARKGNTSAQHVRLDEIRPYVERGQSVVLFQTPAMNDTMIRQVAKKRRLLWNEFGVCPFAMVFGRYKDGWLMFLVLPAHKHRERLLARGRAMVDGAWYEHFLMRDGPLPEGAGR